MADQRERQLALLRAALAVLPDETRTVFGLHAVDGLDFPAIASRLDMSVAEVECRLADAIYHIMRRLDGAGNADA